MLYASVYTRVPDSIVSLMHGSIVFCFTLSSKCMTTCPPRSIMPKTGGFSHIPSDLVVDSCPPMPTVSSAKNSLVYFISIVYIDHPVWRSHREEAKRGPPSGHRITRNEGAMM